MEADWQVIGAAVQGLSHQKQGLPCQDALEYRCLPGGTLLVALADGAGSATRSELGARAAVQTAVDSLASSLENGQPAECCDWVEMFWETFESARAALIQLAEERDEPLRAFATTLTCLAATPEATDRWAVGRWCRGSARRRWHPGHGNHLAAWRVCQRNLLPDPGAGSGAGRHPGDQPADAGPGSDERRLDSPGFETTHQRAPPAVFQTAVCLCRSVGAVQ